MSTRSLVRAMKNMFQNVKGKNFFHRNNLANVLCHELDFGIKVVSYNFFATGHGKTELDGEGGTLKRTATRYNLRSPPS